MLGLRVIYENSTGALHWAPRDDEIGLTATTEDGEW
jgi:hypothetical protein